MKQKIIVFDTETGGLDPQEHSLLQVGILVCEDGVVLDKLKINIIHENYVVTERAMEINRIDLTSHTGSTAHEAVEEITAFVKKHFSKPAQVLGHNVPFDVGFLKELFKSVGANYDRVFSYRLLDTSSIARFLIFAGIIPDGGSLGQLAKQFGVEFDQDSLHDALVDCEVTYKLLIEMTNMFPQPAIEVAV